MGIGGSSGESWQGYDHQLFQDKVKQSYLVPDSGTETSSPIVRNLKAKDGYLGFLKSPGGGGSDEKKDDSGGGDDLDTAWKLITEAVKQNGEKPFMGFRQFNDDGKGRSKEFNWMTYNDFNEYALSFGNGLRSLDIPEKSGIGIYSMNRPEWFALHAANMSQAYRTVALYDTLGPEAVAYIIRHAGLPAIMCEKSKLKNLFEAIKTAPPSASDSKEDDDGLEMVLKFIIQIDPDVRFQNQHESVDDADRATAKELGVTLMGLSDLFQAGKGKTDFVAPDKEDVAYVMYTSGTTGLPKGVLLPHRAFAAMVATGQRFILCSSSDVHLSYLPLAHIFEAMTLQLMASAGARVAFYQGDLRKIAVDWFDIKPTILIGVPRVFAKTYGKFVMKVKGYGAVKKMLVNSAQKKSTGKIRSGKRSSFYDTLVWSKVPQTIGFDRVRLVVSGAAPLPPHIAEFMRIILPNAKVIQGYGMTENCAGCTITNLNDYTLGHVGVPIDNAEVRLIDAPECGYLVKDKPYPRGEIQSRGLTVMQGYYKNPKKTAETIDEDGWLSTGDIGRINPNGTISIIDRRKNMFKTAMGEYIAAEKVESIYLRAASVGQIFLYGNSFKTFVVAVIVPDASVFEQIFRAKGLWTKDLQIATVEYAEYFMEIANKNLDFVKKHCVDEMREHEDELKKFERIKDVHVETTIDYLMQGFTVENGLMTPTFKAKRPQLTRRYIDEIKGLYEKNGEAPLESEQWVKK